MKTPNPYDFTGDFYQVFKKKTKILYKIFQKIEEKGIFSNSFYEASTAPIPTWGKNITKK